MAVLTAADRKKIPASDFALPGGRYPIHDENHARDALARVSANGTPEEKVKVRAAVHRKYPDIQQQHQSMIGGGPKRKKSAAEKMYGKG
jgi:hypothetical protein